MWHYGNGTSSVDTDAAGNALQGRVLRVYTAKDGTKLTDLRNANGETVSTLLTDAKGRYPFGVPEEKWPSVWIRTPDDTWWREDADEMSDAIPDAISRSQTAIERADAAQAAIKGSVLSVTNFGAVGDGVTDETQAFQDALDELGRNGGGTLQVPGGLTYALSQTWCPILPDNSRVVAYGATFAKIKEGTTKIRAMFVANTRAGVTPGYGAGLQNFHWYGGTFTGDFAEGITCCPFALHHAQHCSFHDIVFRECHGQTGHIFDLGAADGVLIDNCTFEGFNPDVAGSQIEAVNVDLSFVGTLTTGTKKAGASGLASRNVTVSNCRFLPLTVGGTTYPASNPMGTHIAKENTWYTNIRFLHNEVVDLPVNAPESTDDTSTDDFYRGGVHMPNVDGFWMCGNTFRFTGWGSRTRAVTIMSQARGVLESSDPNQSTDRGTWSKPVQSRNIWICDNTFSGFNGGGNQPLNTVYVKGVATGSGGYVVGLHVERNQFDDGGLAASSGPIGCAIYTQYVTNASLDQNSVDSYYRGIYCYQGIDLSICGNHISQSPYRSVLIRDSTGFRIDGNQTWKSGPIQTNQAGNLLGSVSHNQINQDATAVDRNGINLDGGGQMTCIGNTLASTSSGGNGIQLGSSLSNTAVAFNTITGGWATEISGSGDATTKLTGNI